MTLRVRSVLHHAPAQGSVVDENRERLVLADDTLRVTPMDQLPEMSAGEKRRHNRDRNCACLSVFAQTPVELVDA